MVDTLAVVVDLASAGRQQPHDGWRQIRFAIFDVPKAPGSFTNRIRKAVQWFAKHPSQYAFVISQQIVTSPKQLQEELAALRQDFVAFKKEFE
jgi:DNA ligase-1